MLDDELKLISLIGCKDKIIQSINPFDWY